MRTPATGTTRRLPTRAATNLLLLRQRQKSKCATSSEDMPVWFVDRSMLSAERFFLIPTSCFAGRDGTAENVLEFCYRALIICFPLVYIHLIHCTQYTAIRRIQ
ncbi:hypothetical protein PLICRDRAFT_424502 [Plicaturopsis crispa FD-325 SS-3]|nr:hypothetical protein PLICRDRAFT_424502 [Plicaturopsis crispa FD-325 SS-3]